MHEKRPYLEIFWSVFFRIQAENRETHEFQFKKLSTPVI